MFILLINLKMPLLFVTKKFISRINTTSVLCLLEQNNLYCFLTSYHEQLKFQAYVSKGNFNALCCQNKNIRLKRVSTVV